MTTARTFYVEIYCKADRAGDALEAQLGSVMDALQSEPGDADIDLGSTNLAGGSIEFSVHLPAETVGDAVSRALATVRSALHGLGHSTPGWEGVLATLDQGTASVKARLSEDDDSDLDPTDCAPSLT
jgi:hypothetical protein